MSALRSAQALDVDLVTNQSAKVASKALPLNALVAPLLATLKESHPSSRLSEVERAFEIAKQAHLGQLRKSGEEYITHPVAVSQILAELGLNDTTIIASLLHDTVEDTPYSIKQLRTDFGDEIANLVDGVTKLDKLTY